ncbi:polymorphic toxin-type HINT domain-containing protein [Nocardiopsis sediminis]|uniref:Polymorphic toxin-type HINT domain-containing protein n=1 Tax=Nocardiopsis sediminis TaxID=1778267 RepID=A0ABV8FLE0_9ACTN
MRKARACLFTVAAVAMAFLLGGVLVGLDARDMGELTFAVLPGLLALPCALRLGKGGRPLFWSIIGLQILGLLQALTTLTSGDPRGLPQMLLPVLTLVFVTRPASRGHLLRRHPTHVPGSGLLRRIHDPERGAGFTEYGAVILLVAAIAAGVIGAGIPGRISDLISGGIGEVDAAAEGSDGSDGSNRSTPPSTGLPAPGEDGPSGGVPEPAPQPEDPWWSGSEGDEDSDIRTVGFLDDPLGSTGDFLSDTGGAIADAGGGFIDGGRNFVGGLIDSSSPMMAWDTITDPGGAVEGWWDGVTGTWNDPLGLFVSPETRESMGDGEYAEAFGYGIWDFGGLFLRKPRPPDGGSNGGGSGNHDRDRDREDEEQDGGDGNREDDREGTSCLASSSFVPGTPVVLADGSRSAIEDVEVGDQVLAFDPLTGEEGPREVTGLISSTGAKTLVTLTIDDGQGTTGTLTATDAHPFWVPDTAEWVDAIDLQPGTWLRTSAGTWTQVTAVDTHTADAQRVHNLTIADLHTYYVGAASANALVHNTNGDCHPDREYQQDGDGVERPVGDRDFAAVAALRAHEIMRGTGSRNLTVAVTRVYNTETGEFENWVTSSNPKGQNSDDPGSYADDPPAGFELHDDEIYVPGSGHAENALREHLNRNPQYRVVEGGTSSNICQGERPTGNCMPIMTEDLGLETSGDYPGTTYTSGQREFWWGGG